MYRHPEVNWSSVFRQAIERRSRGAELARAILEEESDPRVRAVASALKQAVGHGLRGHSMRVVVDANVLPARVGSAPRGNHRRIDAHVLVDEVPGTV
ncbi:MAG: hypothetical protein HYT80_08400 [Euryarchaeota archaeon]|nr:hypothetical protein [Euryarchaeota archaeon]